MEYGALLTDSKWEIIKYLSENEQTPTDLANKTNTSIANISQQLRLLEAYGLVKKDKRINNNEPGKPRTLFTLGKEVTHITAITNGMAEKKDLELDYIQKAILNLWLNAKKEDVYFLQKYFVLHEELLTKSHAVGIIKSTSEEIDLMIITPEVHEFRQKHSNYEVTNMDGKKKKIVNWTHTIEEVEKGLEAHEEYFTKMLHNIKMFVDKEEIMKRIKKIQK